MNARKHRLARLHRAAIARARGLRAHHRYQCSVCRASGVRLFRWASMFDVELFCGPCACKEQNRAESDYMARDQVYGMVAAVPTNTARVDAGKPTPPVYWGYTSVPEKSMKWWDALPWRKPDPAAVVAGGRWVCRDCRESV
jgi:hypothetical protein